LTRVDPGARGVRARVGIGVVFYVHLAAARVAWAEEGRLPVPWPTAPGEVVPYATPEPRKPAASSPSSSSSSITTAPPATAATTTTATTTTAPTTPTATATTTTPSASAATHVGAIGEGVVFVDKDDAEWDLRRLMVALTHRPTDWLRFHIEAGIEHADTFAAQQAVVELAPTPAFGVRAGLLLLPLGIINQRNAPPTYLTVDRPLTDQLIIPTIWRELGAGIFGELGGALRYELDVVRGLDGTGFSAQAPLAGGRGNGIGNGNTGAAFAARLELAGPAGFVMGGSGYYGSASDGRPGLDGVRVGIVEGDARLRSGGFDLRAEFAQFFISNSYRINDYLGLLGQDAISKVGRGSYVQAGYDVLRLGDADTKQELLFFAAYENVNPRSAMSPDNFNLPTITPPGETPPNAPSPSRSFARAGIVYRPLPELAFKVDFQYAIDGALPPPAPPMTLPGAPGTPRPLEQHLAEAARGKTRLGLAIGFAF